MDTRRNTLPISLLPLPTAAAITLPWPPTDRPSQPTDLPLPLILPPPLPPSCPSLLHFHMPPPQQPTTQPLGLRPTTVAVATFWLTSFPCPSLFQSLSLSHSLSSLAHHNTHLWRLDHLDTTTTWVTTVIAIDRRPQPWPPSS